MYVIRELEFFVRVGAELARVPLQKCIGGITGLLERSVTRARLVCCGLSLCVIQSPERLVEILQKLGHLLVFAVDESGPCFWPFTPFASHALYPQLKADSLGRRRHVIYHRDAEKRRDCESCSPTSMSGVV
jgi:hypothetical protein